MNLWTSRFRDTGKLPHVLWDGERSGRLGDLAQRRKELRQYELESYAAIGRMVVDQLTDHLRFLSPPWLTPTIIVDKETQYVVVAWIDFR